MKGKCHLIDKSDTNKFPGVINIIIDIPNTNISCSTKNDNGIWSLFMMEYRDYIYTYNNCCT